LPASNAGVRHGEMPRRSVREQRPICFDDEMGGAKSIDAEKETAPQKVRQPVPECVRLALA